MERLRLAGVAINHDIELGPPVILRRIFRSGKTEWEILPKTIAELMLQGIPENEPTVERARIFGKPPKEAPLKIVKEWTYRGLCRKKLGEDSLSFPSD